MQRERVRDLVVVIPGIMGSVLARNGDEVWNVAKGATWRALKSRFGTLRELTLPADLGDGHPGDGVEAVGVLRTLHVVPGVWSPIVGYDGLLTWLRTQFTLDPVTEDHPGNLMDFPYDWRLSNRYNSGLLARRVVPALENWRKASGNTDAQVVFVCHSMGGLVARHFLELGDGASICRALITLGTPYRGSLGALVSLVNGLPSGLGSVGTGLTGLARSLPSLHQLAPHYACLTGTHESRYPQELELPGPDKALLDDAAKFHREILDSVRERGGTPYQVLPIRGLRQPTPTTADVGPDGRLVPWSTIDGWDEGGDGRVPRLSAFPPELRDDDLAIRGPVAGHGALPDHRPARDELWQFLTSRPYVHRGAESGDRLAVTAPEFLLAGQPVEIEVTASPGDQEMGVRPDRLAVTATITSDETGQVSRQLANLGTGRYRTLFDGPAPGLAAIGCCVGIGTTIGTAAATAFGRERDHAEIKLYAADPQVPGRLFLIPPHLMPEPLRDPAPKPSASPAIAGTRKVVHVRLIVQLTEYDSLDSLHARLTGFGEIDGFIVKDRKAAVDELSQLSRDLGED